MSASWYTKEIFKYKEEVITYGDFAKAYDELGIKEGDDLFLQTEFLTFGKLIRKNRESREELMRPFVSDLKKAIGSKGNLMMTTFSLYPKGGVFDVVKTVSEGGILTEFFRKEPGVRRSIHPTHSFAIEGPGDHYLDIDESTFEDQSIYGKLYHQNATLMFWGAGFYYCTFNHFIEEKSQVPYRKRSAEQFSTRVDGKEGSFNLVRYSKSDRYRIDFTDFGRILEGKGLLKTVKIGGGEVSIIKAKDLFDEGMAQLKKNPYFFLNVEPFLSYQFRLFKQFVKRILGR